MTEVFSIFLQFLIFLILFSFPFTPKILANYFGIKNEVISLVDSHALNIIFFCYFTLIFSFLNLDLNILFKGYFLLSFVFVIFNFKRIYSSNNKNVFLFIFFSLIVLSIFFSISDNLKLEWD